MNSLSRAGLAFALAAGVVPFAGGQPYDLHDLDGSDGSEPSSALIERDGSLYGTTAVGGQNGLGTVFRREADGTVTALHHFHGGTLDGSGPTSALLYGQD